MVCYDGTVLGDLVQWVYGEDGMDGAFVEKQTISLNDREFEHNYRGTLPAVFFLAFSRSESMRALLSSRSSWMRNMLVL